MDAPIFSLVEFLNIPKTIDSEIVVGRPCLRSNDKEIGVRHIIHVLDYGLEFVMMFEAGYLGINISKDVCRQY